MCHVFLGWKRFERRHGNQWGQRKSLPMLLTGKNNSLKMNIYVRLSWVTSGGSRGGALGPWALSLSFSTKMRPEDNDFLTFGLKNHFSVITIVRTPLISIFLSFAESQQATCSHRSCKKILCFLQSRPKYYFPYHFRHLFPNTKFLYTIT